MNDIEVKTEKKQQAERLNKVALFPIASISIGVFSWLLLGFIMTFSFYKERVIACLIDHIIDNSIVIIAPLASFFILKTIIQLVPNKIKIVLLVLLYGLALPSIPFSCWAIISFMGVFLASVLT